MNKHPRTCIWSDTRLRVSVSAIMRNPGVMCLWITRSYEIFNDGHNRPLITVGRPEDVTWWREKREATRAEVRESIESGLPNLLALAKTEGPFAVEALGRQVRAVEALMPDALVDQAIADLVERD